jgi:outer membrane protein OmpA-like peptidoglycan-associated protein
MCHLDVPFVAPQAAGDQAPAGGTAPRSDESAAFGDVRLGVRAKLWGSDGEPDSGTDLAIASAAWFPSATPDGYSGDGSVRFRTTLVLSGASPRLAWALNAGVRTRPDEALPGALPTRVGTSLTLGHAGSFYIDRERHGALGTEVVVDVPFTGGARFLDPRATVGHVVLTGHYRIVGGPFEVGAALGPGFGQGAGSAAFRALAMVGYAPRTAAPPPDRDDDGVIDARDACVEVPGVPSRDALLNGCPEAPPDFDADEIPDQHDACPRVPGRPTWERKTHGCPEDVDRDRDGVPNSSDACPDQPGPRPPEGNGCPPKPKPEIIDVRPLGDVKFETDKAVLLPESDAVLEEVAAVMRDHPEVELVEVQGHTDDTGAERRNRGLSQARADVVMRWLVDHGVAPERLVAKGYGAERPLASNASERGRAANRRVEFHIVKKRGSPHRDEVP